MNQRRTAETKLIGCMILDRENIKAASSLMLPVALQTVADRIIFNELVRLGKEKRPFDLLILKERLEELGYLEFVGGIEYLVKCAESVELDLTQQHDMVRRFAMFLMHENPGRSDD